MPRLKIEGGNYTNVPNEMLNNKNLSWKAKGLFGYIRSKPNDWNFSSLRMSKDSTDGENGTRSGLQELAKLGYLTRKKYQLPDGKWDWEYILHLQPSAGFPPAVNPPIKKQIIKNGVTVETTDNALMPFIIEDELSKLEGKENSPMDIIATFIRKKGLVIENKKQLQLIIRRYVRIANQLSGAYTNKQIFDAAKKIISDNESRDRRSQEQIDWTLETIFKQLTK